ncbi:MAG: DUF4230 domain-containing protein [Oscillospiraceae bacterium]|nr:DUF4230 domain-containing protein [Oscillospiraceae bacterium]
MANHIHPPHNGAGAPRPRRLRAFKLMISCIFITAIIVSAFFIYMMINGQARQVSAPVVTSQMVEEQLQGLSELVTVKYIYSSVGKYETSKDFYGYTIPFTKKSFLLTYNGIIKAGIDLSLVNVKISENRVLIILPTPQVSSHEIDQNSIQVFDESTNLFNTIKIEDFAGFCADEKDKNEARAIENGLLTDASEEAGKVITQFLRTSSLLSEDTEIVVQ